jgi:hypothetical protein
MDRIAERAGAQQAADLLLLRQQGRSCSEAVLERPTAASARPNSNCTCWTCRPPRRCARLTEFTWNYYLEHPEFLTLLNSANLHKARHLQGSASACARTELAADPDAGRGAGARPREGSFRGGVDPMQLYISIAALAYFYLGNSAHAVGDLRTQPDVAQGAQRAPVAHLRRDPRVCTEGLIPAPRD